MKPDNIILEGITGSKAYGLDTETSDTDIKGIYLVDTRNVLSMDWNFDKQTKNHTVPDWEYHEVQKFMKLAQDSNPTILELLFLEDYTILTPVGKLLVDNRHLFLSQMVRKKYGGYALSQAKSLATNDGKYGNGRANRYEKHTRHCFRLLYQGRELLETGNLTVRVTPEVREELFAIGKKSPDEVVTLFEEKFKEFDTIESVLPEKVDKEAINNLLLQIREEQWKKH
jgi:uncharacterized protein